MVKMFLCFVFVFGFYITQIMRLCNSHHYHDFTVILIILNVTNQPMASIALTHGNLSANECIFVQLMCTKYWIYGIQDKSNQCN